MSTQGTPKTGYDLAAKIFATHPSDSIETMLRYSKGAESDWLEFKAGMTLLPEDKEKGDTLNDLYWDYVLSIVAMVNTRGGAFVIGVDDKNHEPVPLTDYDPHRDLPAEGKEEYLRKKVFDRIDRPNKRWTTKGGNEQWELESALAPFLEGHFVSFKGTEVLLILVRPCDLGRELFVRRFVNGDPFRILPFRKLGEIGNVKKLTLQEEIEGYQSSRIVQSSPLGAMWLELGGTASVSQSREETVLYDLFICHQKDDAEIASRFCQALEALGKRCWVAPRDIPVGKNYPEVIPRAIDACRFFLLLISSHSIESPHVESELDQAFKAKKTIFPVRLDEHELPTDWARYYLTRSQIISFRGNFIEAASQIAQSISETNPLPLPEHTSASLPGGNTGCGVPLYFPKRYQPLVEAFQKALVPDHNGALPILDIHSPMPNVELRTSGGKCWWRTYSEAKGWKLQRNRVFRQCRILDDKNYRVAWGWRWQMERAFAIDRTLNHTKIPSKPLPSPVEASPSRLGKAMFFRSIANGRIVTARDAGRGPLAAEVTWTRAWEMFDLHENADGTVSFSAECNGKYVTVRFDQDVRYLEASAETIDLWEKFHVEESDGIYLVKTAKEGFYVQADILNCGLLCAKERTPDTWERFNAFSVVMTNPEPLQPQLPPYIEQRSLAQLSKLGNPKKRPHYLQATLAGVLLFILGLAIFWVAWCLREGHNIMDPIDHFMWRLKWAFM